MEKRGWDVQNLDLPGFGLPEPTRAWGLTEYATYVQEKLPEVWKDKGYVFFGHSFGGRVGVVAGAKKAPGLGRLVLCAPGGFNRENELKLTAFRVAAKWGRGIFGENAFLRRVLYKLARTNDYNRATPRMREVMKKVLEQDLWPLLPKVKLPALVLWGEADRVVPVADGEGVVRQLPEAELVVCPGAGHLLPYRQPEWVAERIDQWFLS